MIKEVKKKEGKIMKNKKQKTGFVERHIFFHF
jgi:hypothetical protein